MANENNDTLMEKHRLAMAISDEADTARRAGNYSKAHILFEQAYSLEKEVATDLKTCFGLEPTRSVLFRSAASLAIECKKHQEAKILLKEALNGAPPKEIESEIHELLTSIESETNNEN